MLSGTSDASTSSSFNRLIQRLPERVKDVQEIRQQTLLKQVIDNRAFW